MNVLIAVHHFPPRFTGGAELRAYRTARALQQRGHYVQVICVENIQAAPGPDGDEKNANQALLTWQDEVYQGVPIRRLSFDLDRAPDKFRWSYANPWIGEQLKEYLRTHQTTKPDVFHLIGGYLIGADALGVVQSAGIPTVVTLTDFWWLCPRINMLRSNGQVSTLPIDPVTCARCLGEEQRRYRILGQIAPGVMSKFWQMRSQAADKIRARQEILLKNLNEVDCIISPSEFLRDMHIEAGIGPEKMVYARQGRDFQDLPPEQLVKSPSEVLRMGYIGQIAHLKGVHILLEALRHIPQENLSLRIYGNTAAFPDYTAELRKMVHDDPRVEFAAPYKQEEISQVLRDLDVIVMPSIWYENSPNVILEAFAHRTPVIASRLGGMAELVLHEQNGLLFETANASDLARQIQRLLSEPGLQSVLSAGITPVKSLAQEMDELEAIYSRVSARERV